MSDLILKVNMISKDFEQSQYHSRNFKEWICLRFMQLVKLDWQHRSTFNVLNKISFEVNKGEIVGILGENGSGKSTLLKILSRITPPTSGQAFIYGKVASIIEVGTGFHKELSGIENIYINGAILGMKRKEVSEKIAAIIAFAEIDEMLIELPIKKFSSGMRIRLAFAITAHLTADLLLLDEVLAVSDFSFQEKSLATLSRLAESGKTILFVTHDLAALKKLCTRLMVIDEGTIGFDGSVSEGINYYLQSNVESAISMPLKTSYDLGLFIFDNIQVGEVKNGDRIAKEVQLSCNYVVTKAFRKVTEMTLTFICYDPSRSIRLFHFSKQIDLQRGIVGESRRLSCQIKGVNLVPGSYPVDLELRSKKQNQKQANFAIMKIGSGSNATVGELQDIVDVNVNWITQ